MPVRRLSASVSGRLQTVYGRSDDRLLQTAFKHRRRHHPLERAPWRAVSDDLRQAIQRTVLLGAVRARRRLELISCWSWLATTVGAALRGRPFLWPPYFFV